MKRGYKRAIKKLRDLANEWPDGISLFSQSGSLMVVKTRDGEILAKIDIPNDGGDAGTHMIEDKEYLSLTYCT